MYNLTNVTEANDYATMVVALNDLSGGLIGIFLLTSLFIIIFMSFKKYEQDTKSVFLLSSTLTTLIGVLFWATGLIAWHILIYPILLFVAAILIFYFTTNN